MSTGVNAARLESALVYAAVIHSGQRRKGTRIPYLSHLLAVTAIAMENGASEDEAIAALLHDAVEDAGGHTRLNDIRRRFGPRVASIVDGCTDAYVIPKPPWDERKAAYIRHLARASASVRFISAADKLHNIRSILADFRSIGDAVWQRFKGGKEGTYAYYWSLARIFTRAARRERRLRPLAREINRALDDLKAEAGFPNVVHYPPWAMSTTPKPRPSS
jgi:(p)ppGpp synthase/HD superfamily hydrolase